MTEQEKLTLAHTYVQHLAEGVNPFTGLPMPEGELLNDVRLTRCFYTIRDLLRQALDNGGPVSAKTGKVDFYLLEEEQKLLAPSQSAIPISQLVKDINDAIASPDRRKLNYRALTQWLEEKRFIQRLPDERGVYSMTVTEHSESVGIFQETRSNNYGREYRVVLYSPQAQQFLLDHLPEILAWYSAHRRITQTKKAAPQPQPALAPGDLGLVSAASLATKGATPAPAAGTPAKPAWRPEEEERMLRALQTGLSLDEICLVLGRTKGQVEKKWRELKDHGRLAGTESYNGNDGSTPVPGSPSPDR